MRSSRRFRSDISPEGSHAGAWSRILTRESSSRYLATRTFGEAPSHGTPAGLAVAAAAERIITPSTCEHLRTRGYAIVDGAMDGIDVDGVPLAEAMLNELRTLSSSPGVMARNATVLVGKDGVANRLEKSNIFEAEVHALSEESLAGPRPYAQPGRIARSSPCSTSCSPRERRPSRCTTRASSCSATRAGAGASRCTSTRTRDWTPGWSPRSRT